MWTILPMHEAAFQHCPETMKMLLEAGADVDGPTGSRSLNLTPLDIVLELYTPSANEAILEMVGSLLQYGAKLHVIKPRHLTPFQQAICVGDREILRLFLTEDTDLNWHAADYASSVQIAAMKNNFDLTQQLVSKGASVNSAVIKYGFGNRLGTPLQLAIFHRNLEMVEFLLDRGAEPEPSSIRESNIFVKDIRLCNWVKASTPLSEAIVAGEQKLIDILLSHGANVNHPSSPALVFAAFAGNIDICVSLLALGADPNAGTKNSYAYMPLDEVNLSMTPLQAAAISGNLEVVKLLIQAGSNPDTVYIVPNGCTALQHAVRKGHRDIVMYLLD